MKAFFKRKFSLRAVLIFFIIMLVSILVFRKITIFFTIVVIVAAITYFNYYIKLPLDISPVLFLSLVISREYTFMMAVLFILLAGIIPMILAGGSFDHTTLFYLGLILIINLINTNLRFLSYLLVFCFIIVLHHLIAFLGSISFGNNPHKEFINLITKLVVDSVYLFGVSGFVMSVFG